MQTTDFSDRNLFCLLGNKDPPAQIEAKLKERLESLNAFKQCPWNVELDMWISKDTDTWQYLFKSLSKPEEGVLLAFKDSSLLNENYRLFEADSQASVLLEKLQTVQVKNSINLKGFEYSFGDFIVRFGSVFEKKVPSFVVVQILYAPFPQAVVPQKVFKEVMSCLCKPTVETFSRSRPGSDISRVEEKGQEMKKGESLQRSEQVFQYFQFQDMIRERSAELSETAFQLLYFLSCRSS